jgi:hypothetical protein
MDAGYGGEIQPGFALFSERFGDRGPYLILDFGCGRACLGRTERFLQASTSRSTQASPSV